MKRKDWLLLNWAEATGIRAPLLLAREAISSVALAHPPGWLDVEVDPETGKDKQNDAP